MLWSIQERTGGEIRTDFRMRHADNSYRWFELEAASVPNADAPRHALRRPHARHHGRQARARAAAARCRARQPDGPAQPRAVARPARRRRCCAPRARRRSAERRLHRHRQVQERQRLVRSRRRRQPAADRRAAPAAAISASRTRWRASAATNSPSCSSPSRDPQELAGLAERVRRSLRAPIKIAGQEIVLTGSIGIAVCDGADAEPLRTSTRRPRSPCTAPSAAAPTASRSSSRRCAAIATSGSRSRASCARRSSQEPDQGALPADHLSADRGAGRLRGAGALGASQARADQPGRFIPIAEQATSSCGSARTC